MAVLRLEDGKTYTELSDIAQELAPLKVQLNHWSVGENPEIHSLLEQDTLSDIEKETVLQALDSYFEQLKETAGYQSRDLIVLYPGIVVFAFSIGVLRRTALLKGELLQH